MIFWYMTQFFIFVGLILGAIATYKNIIKEWRTEDLLPTCGFHCIIWLAVSFILFMFNWLAEEIAAGTVRV